jgi:hypothetical protein
MAGKTHAELMRELRARQKKLGLKEFRAQLLPHELALFNQIYAGVLLQRRLDGKPEELWK